MFQWKQKWDEWVPESRLTKHDEASLKRQSDLQATYRAKSKDDKLAVPTKKADVSGSQVGKKRLRDGATDKLEDFQKRPEIRITLPDSLKAQLVDDWEYVTKGQRLVSLPRKPCVAALLEDFRTDRLAAGGNPNVDAESLNEVIEGLKLYFDKALGTILLYRQERQQYADIIKRFPGISAYELYGAEHLLRLFVQLPQLIAHTTMDQNTVLVLKEHIHDITLYIEQHMDELILKEYENAPPEYLIS